MHSKFAIEMVNVENLNGELCGFMSNIRTETTFSEH
jgi:hypothetical protein